MLLLLQEGINSIQADMPWAEITAVLTIVLGAFGALGKWWMERTDKKEEQAIARELATANELSALRSEVGSLRGEVAGLRYENNLLVKQVGDSQAKDAEINRLEAICYTHRIDPKTGETIP